MPQLSKKVCLLGDFAVGKTSLVRRFVYNIFEDKYLSTIGVKVSRKTIFVTASNEQIELAMMLWDLAGSEEFDRVRGSYLRGAAGAVLVCDLTRPETLKHLDKYINGLLQNKATPQIILAANKQDLVGQLQLTEEAVKAAADQMKVPVYFTSAKTGHNVETLFRHLGQLLVNSTR